MPIESEIMLFMIQFCGSAFSMGAADKQAEIITV